MSRLALYFLGIPRLERDGSPVEVDTRKATALVAYLAVTRQDHARDTLAALLWPEYDQQHARGALRRTLSTLRTALGREWLTTSQESIGLNWEAGPWVDVEQFLQAVARAERAAGTRPSQPEAARNSLVGAIGLYRGDFMAGFTLRDSPDFDDWQFVQTESLRRGLGGLLERLVRSYSEQGDMDSAIGYARRWLSLDPLHEPVHRELMRLYAAAGQRSAALRQYRECLRILQLELGVPPLDETTRLYQEIKARRGGESLVDRLTVETPASTLESNERPEGQLLAGVGEAGLPAAARRMGPGGGVARAPFVGRALEWSQLMRAYDDLQTGGHLIALEGEAGIGKTRLAEEFLSSAASRGAVTVAARCYQGETGLAYAPFVEALRAVTGGRQVAGVPEPGERPVGLPAESLNEAARLVPALRVAGEAPPPALDGPGAQTRFFEGVSQVLVAGCATPGAQTGPGVLFFDDVQWMDSASLELLAYFARRLLVHPLCVLLAWRGDQVSGAHPLRLLLAELQRAGRATHVVLGRLAPGAVAELVRESDQAEILPLSDRLYRETEGLPFFVVQYLAALADGTLQATGDDWTTPGGVRDLIHARLGGLSEPGRQLLGAAAVLGRSFDFDILRDVSGRAEEEVVVGLEELLAQGLVREVPGGDSGLEYDFLHEKLRTVVYEDTSLARRRLLHRRAAESLVARRRNRAQGSAVSLIAQQYRLAGQDALAAEYCLHAGEHARSLYANVEALGHFEAALALGHPDAAGIHEAIGDLQTLLGDYAAGLASYRAALALPSSEALQNGKAALPADARGGPQERPREAVLEHKLGMLHLRRGEWELAASHLQDALAALARSPGQEAATDGLALRSHLLADWSLAARWLNRPEDAEALAHQAYTLADQAADGPALAAAENILGMLARARGDLSQACRYLEASAARAESLGEPALRAAALNNLALTCAEIGEYDRAVGLTRDALNLVQTLGDRHREAALHNNMADLMHRRGDRDGAMTHLEQAVTIFADIRTEADIMQPEIWKLSEW